MGSILPGRLPIDVGQQLDLAEMGGYSKCRLFQAVELHAVTELTCQATTRMRNTKELVGPKPGLGLEQLARRRLPKLSVCPN